MIELVLRSVAFTFFSYFVLLRNSLLASICNGIVIVYISGSSRAINLLTSWGDFNLASIPSFSCFFSRFDMQC